MNYNCDPWLSFTELLLFTSPENVPAFLDSVKRREKVLSGFGHRCVRFELSFSHRANSSHRVYKTVRTYSTCGNPEGSY